MTAQVKEKQTKSDLNQKTQTSFMTLHIITSACHALLNTTFIAPSPKPSWFDDLLMGL